MLKVGTKVKDFELLDGNGNKHKLSDYLGKVVVIYIYPKNNTPGCNKQACTFRDNYGLYKEKDIVLLGISRDKTESHAKFSTKFSLPFPTLSDEPAEVIKYFGAYGEKSLFGKKYIGVKRSTFIIDEKGILINVIPKVSPSDNATEVIKLIEDRNIWKNVIKY